MKRTTKALTIGLMCFTGSVFANSTNINAVVGSSFSKLSNQQYMSPITGLVNSYDSNEPEQSRTFYGWGVAYNVDQIAAKPITFGLGLSLYYINLGNISGIETPGVNVIPAPQDTLTYKMHAKSTTILLEPELIYTAYDLQPYVLGGVGFAWNRLSNFSEGTVPGSLAVPSTSPYPNHTKRDVAYEAGLGLQYLFWQSKDNQSIILHIEYRYFSLGESRLGTSPSQTTSEHITVDHNTSNIVDFGITYRL